MCKTPIATTVMGNINSIIQNGLFTVSGFWSLPHVGNAVPVAQTLVLRMRSLLQQRLNHQHFEHLVRCLEISFLDSSYCLSFQGFLLVFEPFNLTHWGVVLVGVHESHQIQ